VKLEGPLAKFEISKMVRLDPLDPLLLFGSYAGIDI
jgi:hypothetical protein